MNSTKCRVSAGLLCLLAAASAFGAEKVYDVCDYGARTDGKTLCTKSIQRAIDECARDGGGTVYFPRGTFLSGTIYMKSGVTLRLDVGCTLLGSADLKDYPPTVQAFRSYTDNYTDKSLIYGENLERIAITGKGTIDGQGQAFKGPYKVRPYMIRFIQCRNVTVENVTIRNSPMWVQHYLACDDVRISGITVRSVVNANNDGINIDSCHRVIISDCNIRSGDDAIVLKSTSARPCRNVTVSNCVLSTRCNALKMGTESNGGFENIVITGCSIYDTRLAGVALEIVDGGTMDRVVVSNITMNKVGAPIFLRLGNRARPFKKDMKKPGIGILRNVTISNIEATGANATGCAISGLPEAVIENVTLSNVRLSFAGGGTKEDASRDGRHALVLEDVEDALIDGLDAPCSPGAGSILRLTDVKGVFIRGCRPRAGTDVFLKLQGAQSENVVLAGNDLSDVRKVVERAPDVPETALSEMANRRAKNE
ncbi:MAG: glycoside hydrolase family 28 protein [Planctomycetota bacterium]|jgi:uncharacterized protein YjbI with pentapeptide repeats